MQFLYEPCSRSLLPNLCLGTWSSVLHRDGGRWVSRPAWAHNPVLTNDTIIHPVAQARNLEAILENFCSHICDIRSNIKCCQCTPNCNSDLLPSVHLFCLHLGLGHRVSCLNDGVSPLSDILLLSPHGNESHPFNRQNGMTLPGLKSFTGFLLPLG